MRPPILIYLIAFAPIAATDLGADPGETTKLVPEVGKRGEELRESLSATLHARVVAARKAPGEKPAR